MNLDTSDSFICEKKLSYKMYVFFMNIFVKFLILSS